MLWHRRNDADKGLSGLRQTLAGIIYQLHRKAESESRVIETLAEI